MAVSTMGKCIPSLHPHFIHKYAHTALTDDHALILASVYLCPHHPKGVSQVWGERNNNQNSKPTSTLLLMLNTFLGKYIVQWTLLLWTPVAEIHESNHPPTTYSINIPIDKLLFGILEIVLSLPQFKHLIVTYLFGVAPRDFPKTKASPTTQAGDKNSHRGREGGGPPPPPFRTCPYPF